VVDRGEERRGEETTRPESERGERRKRNEYSRHDISSMIVEIHDPHSCIDIPKHTGHISRTGYDLPIVDEPTATEVTRVSAEFPRRLGSSSSRSSRVVGSRFDRVNGADVVESSTGDEVSGRRVGTGHDPGRTKRDGVDFVGGVGVPDDEFPVLRSRNEVLLVGGPVHGVDLCEVTFERSTRLHDDSREGFDFGGLSSDCREGGKVGDEGDG